MFARVAPPPDHPFASFENRTAPWASACGAVASLPIDSSEFRRIVFLLQLADLLRAYGKLNSRVGQRGGRWGLSKPLSQQF